MFQNNILDLFFEGFENTTFFEICGVLEYYIKYSFVISYVTQNVMFQNNIYDLFFEGFENTTFLFLLGSRISTKNIV